MPALDLPPLHHSLIKQQLPTWTRHTTTAHWQRLRQTQQPPQGHAGLEADWFANAAPDLRAAVLAAQARSRASHATLADKLRGLQNLTSFAEPLLAARLQADFGVQLEVSKAQWVDYEQVLISPRQPPKAVAKAPISLLQAALHNFYQDQGFVSPSYLCIDTERKLAIAPHAFATSCRALDLGQRYQAHLLSHYRAPFVAHLWISATQDRLRAGIQLAGLRRHISGETQDRLLALLDGPGQLLPVQQPSLFAIALREVLLFYPQGLGDDLPVVAWLPGAVDGELVEYPSLAACTAALQTRLCNAGFRQFFARFVASAQQAHFFSMLKRNLDGGDAQADEDWTLQAGADLHVSTRKLPNPHFRSLFDQHLQQALDDARLLAVSTADADAARHAQVRAFWESSALNFLNLAAFFVPGLGEVMMAVVAYQLVEEVVEGVQAWQVGDIDAALGHMESVALNVVFIGGLAVAGKAAAQLSKLAEVRLPDGRVRLWLPDLAPYRTTVELPAELTTNDLGQYRVGAKTYVRIDGHLHEQRFDSAVDRWRLVHPRAPSAYQPELVHNGQGAWRSIHEQPLTWSTEQLLRRLGPLSEGLDDLELNQALRISGSSADALRRLHLASEAPPPLLADTLERPALLRQVQTQVASEEPLLVRFERRYAQVADGDGQLANVLQRFPRLPRALARRLLALGSTPAALAEQAAKVTQALPLVRALEGLYYPQLAGVDSQRLLLACLERLPGGLGDLRLELRGGSVDGPLLASCGQRQAAIQRVLVSSTSLDLYSALVQALPEATRARLDVATGQALKIQVLALAERQRKQLPQWLWSGRVSGWSDQGRLRGGTDLPRGYPAQSPQASSYALRYRALYPTASDQEADAVIALWRRELREPLSTLQALENELSQMRSTLEQWAAGNPARQRAQAQIIKAWRQETGRLLDNDEWLLTLELDNLELLNEDLASLELPAGFDHVQELALDGNLQLSALPASLLRRLPELKRLSAFGCRFNQLPAGLDAAFLTSLDLGQNRITWDAGAQAILDGYPNLKVLSLAENPLLSPPDLSRLVALEGLDLSGCDLTQLPAGLHRLEEPFLLDLSDNQFTHLPADLALSDAAARALRLESDHLAPEVLEQIEGYHAIHGADLLVAYSDYDLLLEDASAALAAVFRRLPLDYARSLRGLFYSEEFINNPGAARQLLWQQLWRMDRDPLFRARALARRATDLLHL